MKRKPETEIIRSSRSVINWISQRFDGNTHNAVNQANRSLKNILKQIPQSNEATQKLGKQIHTRCSSIVLAIKRNSCSKTNMDRLQKLFQEEKENIVKIINEIEEIKTEE